MKHFVINIRSEEEKLIEILRATEKPYAVYYKRILPKATTQQMRYLWGVCYKKIADYTGHTTIEVHEALMRIFHLEDTPTDNPNFWELKIRSLSTFDTVEITVWAEQVAAWARTELDIYIPLPYET